MSNDPVDDFKKKSSAWRVPLREDLRERQEALRELRMKERARQAYVSVGGDPQIFEMGWPAIKARLLQAEAEHRQKTAATAGGGPSMSREMLRSVAARIIEMEGQKRKAAEKKENRQEE